jgi:3-hydroxybutyrate dehydrogenase
VLAGQGARVVMNGFGDKATIGAEVRRVMAAHETEALYHGADMSRPDEIRAMIDTAATRFGAVDILVNNAGIQHVEPIETFPAAKWDAILAIDLSSAFFATQAVFAGMKARGWGRIVNVASAHGLIASPFKAAYVAAKHGLVGLTKVTALEGAEHGVTANAICPGYVWTPLVEQQIEGQAKSHGIDRETVIRDVFLKNQPTRRFAQTAEIGALTAFLCSDAAMSITGTALPVDGGWTAH